MRRLIILGLAVCLGVVLTSCNTPTAEGLTSGSLETSKEMEGEAMLEALYRIEKGWTEEQVCELLGQPNRQGEMSSVIDVYYMVDSVTEAAIYYWLDQEATVIEIALVDSEGGQRTVILK